MTECSNPAASFLHQCALSQELTMEKAIPVFLLSSLFSNRTVLLHKRRQGSRVLLIAQRLPVPGPCWSGPSSYLAFHGFSLPSIKRAITILSVDWDTDSKDLGRCWMYVSFCLLSVKFSCKKICFYGIIMNKNHQSSLEGIYFCKVLCKYHFYYELMSHTQRKSLILVY